MSLRALVTNRRLYLHSPLRRSVLITLLKRLILAKSGLDLYDLADSIYISYSTIEKDMIRVKRNSPFSIWSIHRQNGTIDIVGEEHHKRALFSHYLTSNLILP